MRRLTLVLPEPDGPTTIPTFQSPPLDGKLGVESEIAALFDVEERLDPPPDSS